MRNLINLTDEQIEEKFEDLGHGVDIEDVVFTSETIADWKDSISRYNEPGFVESETDTVIERQRVQRVKGEQRRWVIVIDFGAARGVYIV